jgi:hypothetical protein
MTRFFLALSAACLLPLGACAPGDPGPANQGGDAAADGLPSADTAVRWESVASGEGYALRLSGPAPHDASFTISCLRGGRLVVTVPAFEPIGSEDRFAFGLGEEPVTLVADPTRQTPGAGVVAEGPVPEDFAALIGAAQAVSALYGTQQAGPHAAPPDALKRELVAACTGPDAQS